MNRDEIKLRIMEMSEKGYLSDGEVCREFDDNLPEAARVLRELVDEGKLKEAFTPIPGTSYDMKYIVAKNAL